MQTANSGFAMISIHVPRVGDDPSRCRAHRQHPYFYPRPPCGGRQNAPPSSANNLSFLSTSPVWGTTLRRHQWRLAEKFLSTSPVWGTTLGRAGITCHSLYFYPRPPCGGRRRCGYCRMYTGRYFYPRPPCGGRPDQHADYRVAERISIHVPRVGDDVVRWLYTAFASYFYPRPPCGGRHGNRGNGGGDASFLSTSPVWGTTQSQSSSRWS